MIVNNSFFDKRLKSNAYCGNDSRYVRVYFSYLLSPLSASPREKVAFTATNYETTFVLLSSTIHLHLLHLKAF